MKRNIQSLLVLICFQLSFVSITSAQTIVATYGNKKITLEDFEKAFLKNQNEEKISPKDSTDLSDFLKLYVNFKMKLQDAEDRGFSTNPDIQKEVEDYKKEVGVPYYLKKYVKEPAIKKLYDESKYELRVSHILIRPDTISLVETRKRAWSLIRKINNGADFAKLAKKFSADKRSAVNGGDIYWLTAGQTIPEFEKAIYATKPGHIYPKPVKTRFGYHIIKVVAKQKRVPKIKVSHILIAYKDSSGKVDTAAALAKAKKIKAKLDAGADFGKLALKYSDDKGSAAHRGSLGLIQRRMMVKPFDEAAFKLKVGEVSGIVQSRYGFHIIKKLGEEKFPTFKQEEKHFTQIYERRDFPTALKNLLAQIKAETNYEKFDTVGNVIKANKEKVTFGDSYWHSKLHEKLEPLSVCSINGQKISSDYFFKFVQNLPHINGFAINKRIFDSAYSKFEKNILILQRVKKIENSDSEFKQLMQDYRDGVYIFKLQDKEVWQKLKVDSTKLHSLYVKNKSKYQWPDRVSFYELFRNKKDSIKVLVDSLKNGADFAGLAARYTKRNKKLVKNGFYNLVNVKSTEMAARAFTMKQNEISKPFKVGRGWSIIKVVEKSPSHQKTYREALPEVSSLYHELESKKLENEYLDRLAQKYHSKIYYNKLKNLFDAEK